MSRETNLQIAAGFSQGLQNFVQGYTQRKDKEFEQQRQQKRLEHVQAVTDNPNASPIMIANAVSSLPPEEQKAFIPIIQQKAKTEAKTSQLMNLAQSRPDLFPEIQAMAPVNQPQAQPTGTNVGGMAKKMPPQIRPMVQQFQQPSPENALAAAQANPQQAPIQQQPSMQPLSYEKRQERVSALAGAGFPDQARLEEDQLKTDLKKEIHRENTQRSDTESERKENAPFRQKILNRIPATKKQLGQLNRLEQLNEKGVEITPLAKKGLDLFGIPIGTFESDNAQELEKLANDLTANIQSDYGNRILATEFNTFLKRIPTLMNSQEGRRRVIHNMKLYNRAQAAEENSYKKIYSSQISQGIARPIVRQEDVLDATEGELDQIFSEMNRDLKMENVLEGKSGQVHPDSVVIYAPDGRRKIIPKERLQEAIAQGGRPA